jgi:hypothetical protein
MGNNASIFTASLFRITTNSLAPEPESLSQHSEQPAIGLCPEPIESNTHPRQPMSRDQFWLHPLIYASVFRVVPSFGLSRQNLVQFSLLSHACHMHRPPHSPWLNLPNEIWGWVQIMKLLILLLPPFSCYFVPLRNKHSPYNPVLKHPQSMLEYCYMCEVSVPTWPPVRYNTTIIKILVPFP